MSALDLDRVFAIASGAVGAPQWSRQDYERTLLSSPGAPFGRTALVAHCNGALVGFAVANISQVESLAELEAIVVHAGYRRRGIGAELLIGLKDSACRAGAIAMRLEVRESNAAALALYQGRGFQKISRRKSYYSAPVEDALVLEAALIAPLENSRRGDG